MTMNERIQTPITDCSRLEAGQQAYFFFIDTVARRPAAQRYRQPTSGAYPARVPFGIGASGCIRTGVRPSAYPASTNIASDNDPRIRRGFRFTTNKACSPRISATSSRSCFMPTTIHRRWSPKSASILTRLSLSGISSTLMIVATRRSILSNNSKSIGALMGAGFIDISGFFYCDLRWFGSLTRLHAKYTASIRVSADD